MIFPDDEDNPRDRRDGEVRKNNGGMPTLMLTTENPSMRLGMKISINNKPIQSNGGRSPNASRSGTKKMAMGSAKMPNGTAMKKT